MANLAEWHLLTYGHASARLADVCPWLVGLCFFAAAPASEWWMERFGRDCPSGPSSGGMIGRPKCLALHLEVLEGRGLASSPP